MDLWTISDSGHYVGHDGFVCPRTFEEFQARYPDYPMQMAHKLKPWAGADERQDIAQDIWLLLMKNRVIEKYDPVRMHGCNSYRYFHYLGVCVRRKHIDRWYQSEREPSVEGLELYGCEGDNEGLVHHNRSEPAMNPDVTTHIFLDEFIDYLRGKDQGLAAVMDALLENESVADAETALGVPARSLYHQIRKIKRHAKQWQNG